MRKYLPELTFEVGDDPEEAKSLREQMARAKANSDWLQAHWADLLPQARGKFLAVAGQEAHLADTPEEAWGWAAQAHPEDNGALVQYVMPHKGPRIYAHSR